MAAAFLAWESEWIITQRNMLEAVRRRAAANPDIAEKFLNRLRGGGVRLRAWNIWASTIARLNLPPHIRALREALQERDPTRVQPRNPAEAEEMAVAVSDPAHSSRRARRKEKKRLKREAKALRPRRPPRCTPQGLRYTLLQVGMSRRLQWWATGLVIVSLFLMGTRSTCDSPVGLALGCGADSEGDWAIFEARVEVALLLSSALLVTETALRVAALGFWGYFFDGLNLLDFAVSVISLADLALVGPCRFAFPSGGSLCNGQANLHSLAAFRSLRMVRVLRLLRIAKGLRLLIIQLVDLIHSAWSLILLILLLAYTFALIGKNSLLPWSALARAPLQHPRGNLVGPNRLLKSTQPPGASAPYAGKAPLAKSISSSVCKLSGTVSWRAS
jgi:hypothetical protein